MSVLAVLLVLAVAAYVRLAQGPVSLDFLRGTVESKINQALPSMAVSIGGLVMERTGSAGVPHVRLTELRLNDKQGNYLASAPRASLGIDEQALFSGRLVPTSITLIGPLIRARRHQRFLQERQHDMAAAEHQRPGAIEDVEQRQVAMDKGEQRQEQQ